MYLILIQKVQRHNNPHYWLQQDLLQVTIFKYNFFQNITLTDETIPQIIGTLLYKHLKNSFLHKIMQKLKLLALLKRTMKLFAIILH